MCWNCIISVCNSHVQDSQLHTCNTRTHNYIAHSCTRVLLIAARTLLTAAHVYWLTAADVHCSQLQYSQLHTCNTHSCTRAILTATLLTAAHVQCLQLQTCIAHSCPYIAHTCNTHSCTRHTCNTHSCTRAILTVAHVQCSQLHNHVHCYYTQPYDAPQPACTQLYAAPQPQYQAAPQPQYQTAPPNPSSGIRVCPPEVLSNMGTDPSRNFGMSASHGSTDLSQSISLSHPVCRNQSVAISLQLLHSG